MPLWKIQQTLWQNDHHELSEASRDRLAVLEKREKETNHEKLDNHLDAVAQQVVQVEKIIDKDFFDTYKKATSEEWLKKLLMSLSSTRPAEWFALLHERAKTLSVWDTSKSLIQPLPQSGDFLRKSTSTYNQYGIQVRRQEIVDHIIEQMQVSSMADTEKADILEHMMQSRKVSPAKRNDVYHSLMRSMRADNRIQSKSQRDIIQALMQKGKNGSLTAMYDIKKNSDVKILTWWWFLEIPTSMHSSIQIKFAAEYTHPDGTKRVYAMMQNWCEWNLVIIENPSEHHNNNEINQDSDTAHDNHESTIADDHTANDATDLDETVHDETWDAIVEQDQWSSDVDVTDTQTDNGVISEIENSADDDAPIIWDTNNDIADNDIEITQDPASAWWPSGDVVVVIPDNQEQSTQESQSAVYTIPNVPALNDTLTYDMLEMRQKDREQNLKKAQEIKQREEANINTYTKEIAQAKKEEERLEERKRLLPTEIASAESDYVQKDAAFKALDEERSEVRKKAEKKWIGWLFTNTKKREQRLVEIEQSIIPVEQAKNDSKTKRDLLLEEQKENPAKINEQKELWKSTEKKKERSKQEIKRANDIEVTIAAKKAELAKNRKWARDKAISSGVLPLWLFDYIAKKSNLEKDLKEWITTEMFVNATNKISDEWLRKRVISQILGNYWEIRNEYDVFISPLQYIPSLLWMRPYTNDYVYDQNIWNWKTISKSVLDVMERWHRLRRENIEEMNLSLDAKYAYQKIIEQKLHKWSPFMVASKDSHTLYGFDKAGVLVRQQSIKTWRSTWDSPFSRWGTARTPWGKYYVYPDPKNTGRNYTSSGSLSNPWHYMVMFPWDGQYTLNASEQWDNLVYSDWWSWKAFTLGIHPIANAHIWKTNDRVSNGCVNVEDRSRFYQVYHHMKEMSHESIQEGQWNLLYVTHENETPPTT